MYDTTFGLVAPGAEFLMPNPSYRHNLWPACGPAFVRWRKLEAPLAGGENAVDPSGRLYALLPDEPVTMSVGGLR